MNKPENTNRRQSQGTGRGQQQQANKSRKQLQSRVKDKGQSLTGPKTGRHKQKGMTGSGIGSKGTTWTCNNRQNTSENWLIYIYILGTDEGNGTKVWEESGDQKQWEGSRSSEGWMGKGSSLK